MIRMVGAIVAGGRSSRFGSDKALATLRDRALIDHVADRLRAQVDTVVVVGREYPGLISVPDRPHADLGPLGGIAGALAYAGMHGFDAVLSVPCDVPHLPLDLGNRFASGDGRIAATAAFLSELPVIGCWPVDTLPVLDSLLAGGGSRSIRAFATVIGAREVGLGRPLANLNTPADLDTLDAQADWHDEI